jgi:uncharacterized protein YjbI with pentapeptide repeats/beta-lactamase regulating signal transducer with metallopeptidase domain
MHALAAFFEPAARIAVATLFNSLWEGALLAVAVWALLNYLPNINATTRYAAWCVALIAALVVPVVTAIPQVSVQSAPAYHHTATPLQTTAARIKLPSSAALEPAPQVSASQPAALAPAFPGRLRFALPEALALGVFAVWIAASLFLLMRLTFNLFKLETLKRDALPLSLDYREQLARWTRAEKGGRDVRLCVSDHIDVPVAVGLFDSMVLIPKHLLETLSEKEIDQITLHELAHLRRADDWTNGLQRIIQAIFFFNPAVLFMAQQLDLEREVACDDWVLHQTGDVRPYATCLTRMAEVTAWPHRALAAPGVFITRRGLSVRVERLLRAGRNVRTSVSFGPAGAVAAALIVTFFVAQNVAPSFAFTLAPGAHVTQAHSAQTHASAPVKPAGGAVKTTVVYRDKYLPSQQGAFPAAIVAAATPAARATSIVTKIKTKVVKRTTIRNGMVDVNVPAVNVHVPEVNVNVPATEVHVPAVNVHVPAINVNIPAMRYKVPYYKGSLKRVADLNGSCTGCDFSGVQWAGRNLSRVALVGSDFSRADLHGANFSYANLTGVDFTGANLRDVNFANANMEGCDMRHADLTGANFSGAHISGCDIEISKLSASQARAILAGCQGCDFRGANLRGQDLRGLSVSGDDFSSADLRGADMRNASFNGIDFKNARLDGAHLDGASFNGCDFTGVDLRNVDLSHAQITGSKINIMR